VFGRRDPDARGYYGAYGGRFVPETLVAPVEALEAAYFEARRAARKVYDAAERSWLQRKADLVTEANEEWTRFLLGSVLQDIALQESAGRPAEPRADVWRVPSTGLMSV